MTAASAPVLTRPVRVSRRPGLAAVRLLGLELRHNAMLWILPVAIAVFWFVSYHKIIATPAMWDARATDFQSAIAADFIVPVVGAAAWMGSRVARRRMIDQVEITARPRWTRLLVTWGATTIWALVGYGVCLAVVYGVTAQQVTWGGPMWWPAAVAAACMPAYCALGFVAGTLLPGRFTAPVVGIASFFLLVLSTELITGNQSSWQVSPVVAGPWDAGPDPAVGIFYPYVPDQSIAQMMFLAGLVIAALGVMALPDRVRRVRVAAAALAAAGLLAAGTAVKLTGTGKVNAHGMMTIPALHDAATDRPIQFTPVCSPAAIPVCLNPAYASYLPAVAAGIDPLLGEIAGLPGAPVRVIQVAATYQQGTGGTGNEVNAGLTGDPLRGQPPEFRLLLPDPDQGKPLTTKEMADLAKATNGPGLVAAFVGDDPGASQAQHAVAAALSLATRLPVVGSGTHGHRSACNSQTSPDCGAGQGVLTVSNSEFRAAQRFDALPLAVRRFWLAQHLTALRAGQITLRQLP
jgi:hypothetical protein